MFGFQLNSGACGCGCSNPTCLQQKLYQGQIGTRPGTLSNTDASNIRTWLNNQPVNDPSPAWGSGSGCWSIDWSADWDTISDTDPDSGTIIGPGAGALPGGGTYVNSSSYIVTTSGGGAESANLCEFLLPDSTAYIVGLWCDPETEIQYFQQSCVMTGTAVGSCYQFIIPIPEPDLCIVDPSQPQCGQVSYFLIPATDYSGCFGVNWAEFVAACGDDELSAPCAESFEDTPGACLSPDPFYGDSPP
jgi:hypothetical protein